MVSLKNIDPVLEKYVNDNLIAGAGLRVYKEDELLYERFLGYRDAENKKPFESDTICQLASMTKCIAVTAAMQLFEKGEFLLTDPVEKYIPEFANRQVYYTDDRGIVRTRPAKSPVTVGNLFDMTSGISIGWPAGTLNSKEMVEGTEALIKEGKYNVIEYARLCGRVPGNFDPGEHYFYGDSHNMLGALIEVITGQKFSDYLKENIFDPLGMKDMHFLVPEEKKDRVAVIYALKDGTRTITELPPVFLSPTFESACGGLSGTLEDYSRFARCMSMGEWNGVRLLSDRTIKLMATNRLNPTALKEFQSPDLMGYGYGLGVRTHMDISGGYHSSIGEFGWGGAWGTWVVMDPVEKITIVHFHNAMPSLGTDLHPRILDIVYSSI